MLRSPILALVPIMLLIGWLTVLLGYDQSWAAQAKGDLAQLKALHAQASEAQDKGVYPTAIKKWEEVYSYLGQFEDNPKIAAIKETVLMSKGECLAGLAEKDPSDMKSLAEAETVFQELLRQKKLTGVKKDDLLVKLAIVYGMQGNAYALKGEYKDALKRAKKAQESWSKAPKEQSLEEYRARANSLLGKIFQRVGKFADADAVLKQAVSYWEKSNNQAEALRERNQLYSLHLDMGKALLAEKEFEKLEKELASLGPGSELLTLECRVNLAVASLSVGKYGQAGQRLAAAEEFAKSVADTKWNSAIASNRGILRFREGLYDDALAAFQQAGRGPDKQLQARSLINSGTVYLSQYQSDSSDSSFKSGEEKLIEGRKQAEQYEDPLAKMRAMNNLGWLYIHRARKLPKNEEGLNALANALKLLRDGYREAKQLAGENQGTLLLEVSSLALAMGDAQLLLAVKHPEQAKTLSPEGDPLREAERSYREGLDIASRMANMEDVWYARYGLARTLREQKNAPKAAEEFKAAIAVIESMRNLLSGGQSVSFLHDKHMVYTDFIDLLLEDWEAQQAPKAKEQAAILALEYLEKSRLAALKSIFEQALPLETQQLGQELAGLRYEETILNLDREGNKKELEALAKDIAPLEKRLEQHDPLVQRPAIALAECQKRIRPDQAVLEFYYNDKKLYVWRIDGKSVALFSVNRIYEENDKTFDFIEQHVELLAGNIVLQGGSKTDRLNQILRKCNSIYDRLFVKSGLTLDPVYKHLTIIPYRRLSIIPFAALITDRKANTVLGASYEIDSLISLKQLLNGVRLPDKDIYAIGNPVMPGPPVNSAATRNAQVQLDPDAQRINDMLTRGAGHADGFLQLPEARTEVQQLEALFSSKSLAAMTAVDQRVPLGRVLSELSSKPFSYIHFATHGKLLESAPLLSFLAMSEDPEATDPTLKKGFLTVKLIRERMFGKLKETKLCVLSCCQTALIGKAEGVEYASLAGAFQSTGVQNILATLWEVPSEETAELIQAFYTNLLSPDNPEQSYAKALRLAQEKIRSKTNDPFYWAAFIIIGPGN